MPFGRDPRVVPTVTLYLTVAWEGKEMGDFGVGSATINMHHREWLTAGHYKEIATTNVGNLNKRKS